MTSRASRSVAATSSLLLLALVGCEAKKSSNPLSPSVAGPIPGVNISPPTLLQPAQGFKFRDTEQPIRLMIQNAATNGVRPLSYVFDVASDSGFATKVFSRAGVPPGENGQTSVQIDKLEIGRSYYWRARAEDGANTGPFATAGFEIFPKPAVSPPTPVSPINNEQVPTMTPAIKVHNATFVGPVGGLVYEFQIATDQGFSQLKSAAIIGEGSGDTTFTSGPLPPSATLYWHARATDGETTSPWSATQVFRSPVPAPAPSPGPAPGFGGGGSCASRDGNYIVNCLAAKYPDRIAAGVSSSQRIANMEFLRDRAIEAGICGGLDLAWNLKRGTGPRSSDALAWRHDGIVDVVDIGSAYDDTGRPLQLQWVVVAGPPGYDPYPRPNCGGV